jgi:hypothetical protein
VDGARGRQKSTGGRDEGAGEGGVIAESVDFRMCMFGSNDCADLRDDEPRVVLKTDSAYGDTRSRRE